MANVKVQWALPTTRESGNPLNVADIDHVGIEMAAKGSAFVSVGNFPPTTLETLIEGVDTGEWQFRGLVYDVKGKVSQPVVASIIVDETAPNGVVLTLSLV